MQIPKLRVYCAGKIDKNDWRHVLFSQLRSVCFPDAEEEAVSRGRYLYCGPYFIACNHGCFHGPSTHGRKAPIRACWEGFKLSETRAQTAAKCEKWLKKADVVFAWIEEPTAYGTIAEIGMAHEMKKPIFIVFPYGATFMDDLWFCCTFADRVVQAKNAVEGWKLFDKWIKEEYPGDKLQAFKCLGLSVS